METVGVYKAKTHLPKLLERVKNGERIVISKHGIPIAMLQPFAPQEKSDTATVITELRRLQEKCSISGITIREMIDEGRR